MDLDADLTQTQADGTTMQVDIKNLLAQMRIQRLESRHCSHHDPQTGIMNLRIHDSETGLYGCAATHNGEKNGCRGLKNSMTGFGEYNLFICEYEQPD